MSLLVGINRLLPVNQKKKTSNAKKIVGQQTNNGWFRAKIKKSFFGPFPLIISLLSWLVSELDMLSSTSRIDRHPRAERAKRDACRQGRQEGKKKKKKLKKKKRLTVLPKKKKQCLFFFAKQECCPRH